MQGLNDDDIKRIEDLHISKGKHSQYEITCLSLTFHPTDSLRPPVLYQGYVDDFAPPAGPPPGRPPANDLMTKESYEPLAPLDKNKKDKKCWGISPDNILGFAAGAAVGATVGSVVGYKAGKRKGKKEEMERKEENEATGSEDGEDNSEGEDAVEEKSTAYAEYSHFNEWPLLDVDRECDICDETTCILGPYIHCKKCNDGDFDICQGCLFQGFGCKGKGHKWLKQYLRCFCDPCGQLIQG
ncbi:unnamed protein product, partial [Clonostachys chloroleuca]